VASRQAGTISPPGDGTKPEESLKELTVKNGGKLEYVRWAEDDETEEGAYVPFDVTDSAAAYVMEPVRFDGEIYVRDIFSLLDRNPVLVQVFRRVYAVEYLQETKKGGAIAYTGEYDPEGIEYLELFYNWEKDRETDEITGIHQLSLRGVGYELRDNVEREGDIQYEKGTRIQWGVEYSPVGQIFNLPLRFNSEVFVVDSRSPSATLHNFRIARPTLSQVIHAVLWELSWAGGPKETDEFVEMIRDAADDANMSGPMTAESVIEWVKSISKE
jgi:hypothetical protein